jgi:hypothetical protein
MLVVDDDQLAFALSESISRNFIADFMRSDFRNLCLFMRLIFDIIKIKDKKLYKHLKQSKIEPYVALSWLITWFAHDVKSLDEIARVYDAILSSPPIFSIYLCATVSHPVVALSFYHHSLSHSSLVYDAYS